MGFNNTCFILFVHYCSNCEVGILLVTKVEKVACICCLDKNSYSNKHYLFLNISELKEGWAKEFMNRIKDDYDSYTVVRKVLYD